MVNIVVIFLYKNDLKHAVFKKLHAVKGLFFWDTLYINYDFNYAIMVFYHFPIDPNQKKNSEVQGVPNKNFFGTPCTSN